MRKPPTTLTTLLLTSGLFCAAAATSTQAQSGTNPQVPVSAAPATETPAALPVGIPVQINARRGSWRAVENLPPGTQISVQPLHGRRFRCVFESATGADLVCEPLQRVSACLICVLAPISYGPIHTDPNYVRNVHIEHPAANTAIGVAAGAATGLAWGAQDTDASRPVSMAIGGVLLGSLGGLIGRHVPIIRGTVVYER